MSYTVECWDIQTARGPYLMGPFNRLDEAQSAYSGYELHTKEHLYLIRKGHVPGDNIVVAAVLQGAWTSVPTSPTWWERLPTHALARLRTNPAQALSGRQLIEVVTAGGSLVGSGTSREELRAHLTVEDQRAIVPQPAVSVEKTPVRPVRSVDGWLIAVAVGATGTIAAALISFGRRGPAR